MLSAIFVFRGLALIISQMAIISADVVKQRESSRKVKLKTLVRLASCSRVTFSKVSDHGTAFAFCRMESRNKVRCV